MKREIKFRAWDKDENKYFEPIYEAYKGNLLDMAVSFGGSLLMRTLAQPSIHESVFPDRFILEQYTGLTDKNGKGIFEGDICNFQFGAMYGNVKIAFYDGAFRLEGYPFDDFNILETGEKIEIIGNVHEHPHLLKPDNQ